MNTTLTPKEQMEKLAGEIKGRLFISNKKVPSVLITHEGITYSICFMGKTGRYHVFYPFPGPECCSPKHKFVQKIGLMAWLYHEGIIEGYDMSMLRGGYSKMRGK